MEHLSGRHNGPFAVLVQEIDHPIDLVIEEHLTDLLMKLSGSGVFLTVDLFPMQT
jgi:hypothetical protein